MNVLLLSMLLSTALAEYCVRLLRNRQERRIVRTIPGRIWIWHGARGEFEGLEALRLNDTAFCSVETAANLTGRTVVVGTDLMNPYIMRNADNTGVTGFIGDVWTTLEKTLGLKTIYRSARLPAGQTLMNGQAHALLVATAIYSYTSGYYTYSTPITTNSYGLFVQSDGPRVSRWWYARIFSPGLWLTAFTFVMCIAAAIMGIHYLKRIVCTNYAECDNELSSASFDLLFVLGGISGQGFQKIPNSWSLRLVILSHLIMGMLLSCGFNSTLTSYLAIRGNSVPLSGLQDVMKKRTHSLCVRNDSSAYVHFTVNGSLQGELTAEWKELVNEGCPDMRDSGTLSAKVCQPGFVYLEAPDVFLPIYRKVRKDCHIVQIPGAYWSLRIAFLHSRHSQYRYVIDLYLMRLRSSGILKYLENKWISREIDSTENLQWNSYQPVEYGHIHLAAMGLLLMMLVSTLVCLLENIWWTLRNVFRRKRVPPRTVRFRRRIA